MGRIDTPGCLQLRPVPPSNTPLSVTPANAVLPRSQEYQRRPEYPPKSPDRERTPAFLATHPHALESILRRTFRNFGKTSRRALALLLFLPLSCFLVLVVLFLVFRDPLDLADLRMLRESSARRRKKHRWRKMPRASGLRSHLQALRLAKGPRGSVPALVLPRSGCFPRPSKASYAWNGSVDLHACGLPGN